MRRPLTALAVPAVPGPSPAATPAAALRPGGMIVYEAGEPVAQSRLTDLGGPAELGGTVLEGDPRISVRIDHAHDGVLAGVFQVTTGRALIRAPATEHATILDGEVTLTDPHGRRARLRPGDSYLIRQGTDILWEVDGARVQGSFLNRTRETDAPAPMTIYRAHDEAPQSDLADLGAPADLGGTVLDGDPRISARIDDADGPALAGVFQATRGHVLIDFPFTEHATVLEHAATLTDETGARRRLEAGDSYLIRQGSDIMWEVGASRMQKSFLNVTEP